MNIVEQIKNVLEAAVRGSLAVIVEGFLNVFKEILKFILILLIVYYFATWTFQFLDDVFQEYYSPAAPPQTRKELKTETDLVAHQIAGETCLRIGPPDENLIKQRASLLEQLEIEAEFEENQKKLIKSEADLEQFLNKEIHTVPIKTTDSDDIPPYQFVSQIKQELNETSRASQTIKTSLGKKSKLREQRADNEPSTSRRSNNDQEEEDLLNKFNANKILEIKKETLSDQNLSPPIGTRSNTTKTGSKTNQERQSFDDQYDHESFHRV